MKFVSGLVVVLVLLVVNVSWAGMMETVPAGEEVYRWVYEYIDELYARGLISDLHLGTRPYFRAEVAQELLSLRERIKEEEVSLAWPQEYLLEELVGGSRKLSPGGWTSRKDRVSSPARRPPSGRPSAPTSRPRSVLTSSPVRGIR